MAVGPSGRVYVTGGTISGLLPVSPGAFQLRSNEAEGYAAFVTALNPSGDPVPGLVVNRIERRGNRIRLHGSLDPLAGGEITASAHSGRTNRRLHLRRHRGRLVATASLAGRRNWRIEIHFAGSEAWEDGGVCRAVRLRRQATAPLDAICAPLPAADSRAGHRRVRKRRAPVSREQTRPDI